jgi:hypothetical protein
MRIDGPSREDVERVEEQLFRSFSQDEPSAKARRLVAGGLGLATGLAPVTLAAARNLAPHAISSSKVGTAVVLKWLGVGVVAGTVSLGASEYASSLSTGKSSKETSAVVPALTSRVDAHPAPTKGRSTDSALEALREDGDGRPPSVGAPIDRGRTRGPAAPRVANIAAQAPALDDPAAPPVSSALSAEIKLLDGARRALSRGDVVRGTHLLDEYSRRFPAGTLRLEANVLLVEDLFLRGESRRAAQLAQDILSSDGASTHASRVRYLLSRYAKR